jgi:hypothetical protein
MFKGYEEARVALSALLFTMPCCIIIGIDYGIFMGGKLRKVTVIAAPLLLTAEQLLGSTRRQHCQALRPMACPAGLNTCRVVGPAKGC